MIFKDRQEAGKLLAKALTKYQHRQQVVILAIPRGGVVVGAEIAKALKVLLDILVIKKIGFPGNEELALGAVGLKEKYLNQELLSSPEVTKDYLETEIQRKQQEIKERYALFRGQRKMYSVRNKIVIVVDDGIATGATMIMALRILRKQQPKKLVVAVPVAPPETGQRLQKVADEVICLEQPLWLGAIGQWYQEFEQVEDEEAKRLLQERWQEENIWERGESRKKGERKKGKKEKEEKQSEEMINMQSEEMISPQPEEKINIPVKEGLLQGTLTLPPRARGLVLFVHGSGSSRFSPRNRFVAGVLQNAGLATFLLDLLTKQEERIDEVTREFRFNIPLLAERVVLVTEWMKNNLKIRALPFGYFGASTGAAAALIAAATKPNDVKAVVSRGGRPDLALKYCPQVQAATLLIVGEWDEPVIEMNKEAYKKLNCPKKLVIVPAATHLFEEPGKLEEVAELAKEWFKRWLR